MCSFHMAFEGLISQCNVDGQLEFASLFSTIISLSLIEANHSNIFECQSISSLSAFLAVCSSLQLTVEVSPRISKTHHCFT